jgi:hypothetical protein
MLGSIIQLNQLESLSLQETRITDEDAVQIARLTKLKTLLLNGSKVTDAVYRRVFFCTDVPSQAGVATPATMCFRSFCELFQNTKTA